MTINSVKDRQYDRLTWEEMNDAIGQQLAVILPDGSTEQHGLHLPLNEGSSLCESVCLEAGRRPSGTVLVLPTMSHGMNLDHIDCPGTVHVEPEVFIASSSNITKSEAYHGLQELFVVNGHRSSSPLADIVARRTVLGVKSFYGAIN